MSHEIRTPMNAVLGLTHLALQTDLTLKQKDYLEKIKKSAQHLLGIINDILDFSKIEAGKLQIENTDFDLEDLLINVSNITTLPAEEKGLEIFIRVEDNTSLYLRGDALRLNQVLMNLVNNAIKFTETGHIIIQVQSTGDKLQKESSRAYLKISVIDTGIGLTEEQKNKLFQSFTQADSSITRRYGGTGLGLAICKHLVELMGGSIGVESEIGRGSTFYFSLPLEIQKNPPSQPTAIPDLKKLRALVVDDNAISLEIIKEYMENFGCQVTTAESGNQAIEILKETGEPFHLIIVDWKMPEIDGLETIQKVQADEGIPLVPAVIMVSAYSLEELKSAMDNQVIDAFLVKPISQSFLLDSIMNIMGKKSEGIFRPLRQKSSHLTVSQFTGKILLAEDNLINQQVALEVLQNSGFEVMVASDGRQAVEMASHESFDLILMDLQMPKMDGLEAARILRQEDRLKETPIIAMTAHAMTSDRERCLEAGMNDHIAKPFDPEVLLKTIARWLKANGEPLPV